MLCAKFMGSIVLLSILFIYPIRAQELCDSKETCGDCIKQLGCVWCLNPKNVSNSESFQIRCKDEAFNNNFNWCDKNDLIEVESSRSINKDEDLRSGKGNIAAVQIRPQNVTLRLRVGEEYKLEFQYAQAEDYPVDLYYIMDLSASMKVHKNKLSELGSRLAQAMKNITSNFRLGFGSFVDKTDMPFVSTVPSKFKEPCTGCASPYSFQNHMSLTENTDEFKMQVRNAKVSGNLDFPEGGFDAIMQAIVCKEEIGWRQRARHLLVFSTDASFHIAGDGKLAGVVEPNDGNCHMKDGKYTHALQYDYPSISHINYVAKRNNVNLIFAIVESQQKVYNVLKSRIENSASGILDAESNNVIKLVTDTYKTLVDSIKMTDNSGDYVDIKYSSTCPKFSPPSQCSEVRVGVKNNYTATIKVLQCPPKGSSIQTIHIKPESLNESLAIELEVICECPCEKPGDPRYQADSPDCDGHGNKECGICKCHKGKFGKSCDCNNDVGSSGKDDFLNGECRMSKDKQICSNSGVCKCGQCECNKRPSPEQRIYGKFCECDNYSCNMIGNQLCSGPDHGTCDCGRCKCNALWTGDTCECPNSAVACWAPGENRNCSGHGVCNCGQCICNMTEKYRRDGQFCETCPSCPDQKCDELKHCVECKAYNSGLYDENACKMNCSHLDVYLVQNISNVDAKSDKTICTVPINSGCTIVFEYFDDITKKNVQINALKEQTCPKKDDLYVVIGGVIGSIVLAGIILLIIWKVCTTYHDRKEYEKFEKERAQAKWGAGDNPLYKSVNSRFENPLFNRFSAMMHK